MASVAQSGAQAAVPLFKPAKPTLIDVPVSNHGGRVRYLIYAKKLEQEVDIQTPKVLGGLRSEQYLELHPGGKMPLLMLPGGQCLPESDVIANYIVDKYQSGPSFHASTPELRARANAVCRIHDMYVSGTQACMYKAMGIEERADKLRTLHNLLNYFERMLDGPYVCGSQMTLADATLFPTFVFFLHILPSRFGWRDVFDGRPKLRAWWEVIEADGHATRVIGEIKSVLRTWDEKGRWKELGIEEQVSDESYKWAY